MTWPYLRDCFLRSAIPDLPLSPAIAAIRERWSASRDCLLRIRQRLASVPLPSSIETIGVCGSLARMEANDASDADLMVVSRVRLSESEAREVVRTVWCACDDLPLEKPRDDGIFSAAVDHQRLCTTDSIGKVDEDMAVFGIRIQMLLEAQPVYNDDVYQELLCDVAGRYRVLDDSGCGRGHVYLISDLARYFRSLCVSCQGQDRDNPARWRMRNIKLRHSRLTMFAALLLALKDGMPSLDVFQQTPLERVLIQSPVAAHEDLASLIESYGNILRLLADVEFRRHLAEESTEVAGQRRIDQHAAYQRALTELEPLQVWMRRRLGEPPSGAPPGGLDLLPI